MGKVDYALRLDDIDDTIESFRDNNKDYDEILNETIESNGYKKITIKKGKQKGILIIQIKKGGRVSFLEQCDLGEDCKKLESFLIEKCEYPIENVKQYETVNVNLSDFDALIDLLKEEDDLKFDDIAFSEEGIRNRYKVKDEIGAVVTLTCYNNCKVMLQGVVTPLFINLLEWISGNIAQGNFKLISSIQNEVSEAIKLRDYIPDTNLLTPKFMLFIKSSINIANCGAIIPDNSGIITSLMKVIEGLLWENIYSEGLESKDTFDYFEKNGNAFVFRHEYKFRNEHLKSRVEEGYTFLHNYRHPNLHIDKHDIQGTPVLGYSRAIEILKEGLQIINRLLTVN